MLHLPEHQPKRNQGILSSLSEMQESQNPWSALDIRYSSISNPFLLNLLAASHKRDAALGQITLNQVQITGGKGNKAAIGIVANKDNGTGQIPLASQCDDLTRVVTESHRHIVADREYPIFQVWNGIH